MEYRLAGGMGAEVEMERGERGTCTEGLGRWCFGNWRDGLESSSAAERVPPYRLNTSEQRWPVEGKERHGHSDDGETGEETWAPE